MVNSPCVLPSRTEERETEGKVVRVRFSLSENALSGEIAEERAKKHIIKEKQTEATMPFFTLHIPPFTLKIYSLINPLKSGEDY